jgi:hypothetical protein
MADPSMEAVPVEKHGEPRWPRKTCLMEDMSLLHCPALPVYKQLLPVDGIVHIRVPDEPLEKASKLGLFRRDRALLAADVLQRGVDMSSWPVPRAAEAFGASKRSVFEALNYSVQERDEIRNGKRPLFPRRSSIPDPTLAPAQYLELARAAAAVM